jgi:hypothetical protein
MIHYVKFLRLTTQEFNEFNHKDNDTLYFVYDEDSDNMALYLGNKMVTDGAKGGEGVSYLKGLQDISIEQV